jgi:hypothetical protein
VRHREHDLTAEAAAAEHQRLDRLRRDWGNACEILRDGSSWVGVNRQDPDRVLRRASAAGLDMAFRTGGTP